MSKKLGSKVGYVEAKVGDETVYVGYYVNGRLFITEAPAFGEVWYRGLLSEVEYENERMGNPMRYAYEKHGENYTKHLVRFTKEILDKVKERFSDGEVNIRIIPMTEDHVKEILGLPSLDISAEGTFEPALASEVSVLSPGDLREYLRAMHYTRYCINGEGDDELKSYLGVCESLKRGGRSFLLIYPDRVVLAGNLNGMEFVALAPGIKVALETLLWISRKTILEGALDVEERMPLDQFADVGVPLAKVLLAEESRIRLVVFRHTGKFITVDVDTFLEEETLISIYEDYGEWVEKVMNSLRFLPPPTTTKPAWSRIVEAYLIDFPHPSDFKRIINVEHTGQVEIPECKALTKIYASST